MQQIDYDSVAELYDAYVTADFDVPFFLAECEGVKGPVLELTSGTGRLSVRLAEAGVDLTCVDASRGMLDVLARKLAERGLTAHLLQADMCALDQPGEFDLVLLPFQSFMEIIGADRQREVLERVFAALKPGGRFICTMHNPTIRRVHVDGALRAVGAFPYEGGSLVVSGYEQGGHPVVSRMQFFEHFGADGLLRWKRMLPMEFEMVEREDFEEMALDAGYTIAGTYGNYDRSELDPATSPVMIWMLEKRGK